MEKLILIRYAELSTKKNNIKTFLTQLKNNILFTLKDIESTVYFDKGRMFIETNNYEEVIEKLQKIPGIQAIILAYKVDTDVNNIKDNVLKIAKEITFKTFKITTKRTDKNFPINSMDFSKELGAIILKNIPNIKVDVKTPELNLIIEIRKDKTYIYSNEIKGLGGYPVGSNGKGLLMLSGGIDSPVAGYLTIKRGIKLEAIYFAAPPHTSLEAQKKVETLARNLAVYNNDIKLHIINFTKIEEAIYRYIPRDYLITIMRRMMYRISTKIAQKNKLKCLVNGESVGQVASQTLSSMTVINEVTKMPVLRPLVCFDKLEIIELAKKINTYETSILPYIDCCTIFVPDHPVINPNLDKCLEYEQLIPWEEMLKEAIKNEEIIKIKSQKEKEYKDIL